MSSATHRALHLPEVLFLVGSFLSKHDAISCVLVSHAWLQAFQPVLWYRVTANDIPPQYMIQHAQYIRILSLSDLKGLEEVLEKCMRLETLTLWPDTFEDEEDEEDEDDEDDYAEESIFSMGSPPPPPVPQQSQKTEQLPPPWAVAQEDKINSRGTDNSQLTNLLLRNPNLTRLELYVENKSPGASFWRALAGSSSSTASCPRLVAFQSLSKLQVYKHIHYFMTMCTRLESLELERCSLRQLEEPYYSTLSFPRLKEIKLGRIRDMSLQCQLLILKRCPELQSLEWRVPRLGLPVEEFCMALREGCWKKLHSLALPESRLTDAELAQILWSTNAFMDDDDSVPTSSLRHSANRSNQVGEAGGGESGRRAEGLIRFEARRSDFAAESFGALKGQGHFRTLRHLDLFQCTALASWMIAEILRGCPLLEFFDAPQVLVKDIFGHHHHRRHQLGQAGRGTDHHGPEYGDWACKGIRVLEVHIAGFMGDDSEQDMEMQWHVFGQLAKLEQLRFLSIGGRSSLQTMVQDAVVVSPSATILDFALASQPEPGENGPDLRLLSGLGQLATLQRLRTLRFTATEQRMRDEDVEWMANNLPELKLVLGRLHSDEREHRRLEKILERHGIATRLTNRQENQTPGAKDEEGAPRTESTQAPYRT
ncbi:hypothetical protein B0O80DRAFT_472323 [Mortierella sp. GBAus27b]|nr:hypothetical protein BGX31_009563 [Mortierella sp. GBA43]KAI8345681.1 hypothetical protein B0O80DRAFT_472323 [Mortierella sp. GBAus27b]